MESWKHDTWKRNYMALVGGSDMCRCTLCNTGEMPIKRADEHFCGSRHRVSLEAEFRKEGLILVNTANIFSRISELGLPKWRLQVHEQALKFLIVDSTSAYLWPYSREDGRAAVPASLVKQLRSFMNMEVASLLELVAWKLNCLYLDGSGNFHTMQDILDQWAIDENFDPVEYKRQRRMSSNVGVIVERVLEFLW